MKHHIQHILFVIVASLTLSSCLGDNEDEIIYYDDAAITQFTLGNLNQYLQGKTFDGQDSTIVNTITGSDYKFTIDQINHQIYNTTPLPYGTDITKVTCTVTAKNGGVVMIQNIARDSIKVHSPNDSLDFTQPRAFTVQSNSTRNVEEYIVTINVKKQADNVFEWQQVNANNSFVGMTSIRAFEMDGRMYVVGSNELSSTIAYTDIDNGETWEQATPNINTPLPANMPENMAVANNRLYTIVNGQLISTYDGTHWQTGNATNAERLIGAYGNVIFGLTTDGNILSTSDEGKTWQTDELDAPTTLLPRRDINIVGQTLKTNTDAQRVLLIGNRDTEAYPNDKYATVWSRIIETGNNAPIYSWMHYSQAAEAPYQLPRLRNITTCPYDDGLIAIGGQPLGACQTLAFSAIYFSADAGLTWKEDSRLTLPKDFVNLANTFAMTVDSKNFVWLINAETGNIWRARLSQLAEEEQQTIFRTFKK